MVPSGDTGPQGCVRTSEYHSPFCQPTNLSVVHLPTLLPLCPSLSTNPSTYLSSTTKPPTYPLSTYQFTYFSIMHPINPSTYPLSILPAIYLFFAHSSVTLPVETSLVSSLHLLPVDYFLLTTSLNRLQLMASGRPRVVGDRAEHKVYLGWLLSLGYHSPPGFRVFIYSPMCQERFSLYGWPFSLKLSTAILNTHNSVVWDLLLK